MDMQEWVCMDGSAGMSIQEWVCMDKSAGMSIQEWVWRYGYGYAGMGVYVSVWF